MTSDALPALNVIIALIGCAVGHDCARAATGANRTTRTTIDVRMRDMPLPPSRCLCSRIFSTGDGHCAWGIWPALSVLRTREARTMIRIGIIGLGWWGKQIVTCLAESPRFGVFAGCDIDTKMAAPFAAAHKLDLVDDYRSLIRRTDLDAVAVVTPHLLHEEMTIAALEAGKQVFCEKPLALTAASAE